MRRVVAAADLPAALVGGALATVSTSIDGFAMKPLALTWAASSTSDAAAVLGLAGAVLVKVVVDAGNGVAGDLGPVAFQGE